MTTGFAGPYDLVAAIVMAILAAVLVWVSVYTPPWLGWCLRIWNSLPNGDDRHFHQDVLVITQNAANQP
jgi:hypothetical protein